MKDVQRGIVLSEASGRVEGKGEQESRSDSNRQTVGNDHDGPSLFSVVLLNPIESSLHSLREVGERFSAGTGQRHVFGPPQEKIGLLLPYIGEGAAFPLSAVQLPEVFEDPWFEPGGPGDFRGGSHRPGKIGGVESGRAIRWDAVGESLYLLATSIGQLTVTPALSHSSNVVECLAMPHEQDLFDHRGGCIGSNSD